MLKKIIMYLSAFLPMFFIMWIKAFIEVLSEIIEKNLCLCVVFTNWYLIIELLIIIVITIVFGILIRNNKRTAVQTVKIQFVKNRSAEYFLSYYSVFILSLISFSFLDLPDIIVLLLIIFILGIVYIKNDLFFMNPTINIFNSYIYEANYEMHGTVFNKLIISHKKLSDDMIIDIDISEFGFTFLRKIEK